MAKTLTLTWQDDAKYTRDINAFCNSSNFKYPETVIDEVTSELIPNPQSKKNFTEARLEAFVKEVSKDKRKKDAINNLIIEE